MKTKTYTKHKKNTKNDEWEKSGLNCTMPMKSARLKKESQLDRIERKLDELARLPFNPVYATVRIVPTDGAGETPTGKGVGV